MSYGKADNGRETKSGTHIVARASTQTYSMCNAAFNYYEVSHVTWAVRINNNGEFIHENDLGTSPYQGKANVSHGCVNMSTANAKDYYNLVVLRRPVETGRHEQPADRGRLRLRLVVFVRHLEVVLRSLTGAAL